MRGATNAKRSKLCNGRAAGPFRQCRIGWTDAGIDGVGAHDGSFLALVGAFEEVGKILASLAVCGWSTAWCRPPRKNVAARCHDLWERKNTLKTSLR